MFCDSSGTLTFGGSSNTSKVTSMENMFQGFSSDETLTLSGFNTSSCKNMSYMFNGADITNLAVPSYFGYYAENMSYMFANRGHKIVDGDGRVTYYYAGPISNYGFNTQKVEDMSYMFSGSFATSYDLQDYNTSNVKTMEGMFYNCVNLNTILVSADNWVISSDCNTTSMFYNCGTDTLTYV
jgi:hypothetical protein